MCNQAATRIASDGVCPEARLAVLECELEAVKWLISRAGDMNRIVAASQRIQELEHEIDALKTGKS